MYLNGPKSLKMIKTSEYIYIYILALYISRSKLAFPQYNTTYSSAIAVTYEKKPAQVCFGTPVVVR
jgi:hypothetical protein